MVERVLKNPDGKNFRKLLRRKQPSAKIPKISRDTLKSSNSDIFYLLRNLLKYLVRTCVSSEKFSEVFTLCVFTLWLFPVTAQTADVLKAAFAEMASQSLHYVGLCSSPGHRSRVESHITSYVAEELLGLGVLEIPGVLKVPRRTSRSTCFLLFSCGSSALRNKPQSEVSKRGWRTEGVGAKKSFLCQSLSPLFCTLFLCPLRRRGTHFWGTFFACFVGVC